MTQSSINPRQTLQAIQKQHEMLLRQSTETDEFDIEQIRPFLKAISQAGTNIENADERSLLRNLLRYWSGVINDKTGEFPVIQLQPFNSSSAQYGISGSSKIFLQDTSEQSISPLSRQNRQRMLKRVRNLWIEGVLEHSLHHAALISLRLHEQPDALANPWHLAVQETNLPPRTLPPGTSIVEVYDQAEGELLILGMPGAGKTTLLLELARALLERAGQDEQQPIPVVFNLSSWAEKRLPLTRWLEEELWTKYQVPRQIGKSWVDAAQILPLLDGLDEVAEGARVGCVQAINAFYRLRLKRGNSPLVVCCRSEEYMALSTYITVHHAVSILPLSDEQIDAYLEHAGASVEALRHALQEDAELHNLARQPLMLVIFTLAYQGAMPAEIPSGETGEKARRTVFAIYVEHMLRRRQPLKRWEEKQVMRWLAFLAKHMQQYHQTIFSVERLQPNWLSGAPKELYRWSIRLIYGLLFGLLFGLVVGLLFGLLYGLVGGLLYGLVVGLAGGLLGGLVTHIELEEAPTWSWEKAQSRLVVGLVVGLLGGLTLWLVVRPVVGLVVGLTLGLTSAWLSWRVGGRDDSIEPVEVSTWSWDKARSRLPFWLVIGLVVGLLFGLLGGLVVGLVVGLVGGLVVGLVVGLVGGLLSGLSLRQIPEQLRFSPNEGTWSSGKNGLVVGLVVGLPSMLSLGMFFGLLGSPVVGLPYGLTLGVASALGSGSGALLQHFTLRFWLWCTGCLPWNLVPFLDEMAERLLLRKAGGGYIFVHRFLLDYFASLEKKEP